MIDLQGGSNNLGGGGADGGGGGGMPRPMGFIDFPQPPQLPPRAPSKEFEAAGLPYPPHDNMTPSFNMNIPPYVPGQEPPFNPNVQFDPVSVLKLPQLADWPLVHELAHCDFPDFSVCFFIFARTVFVRWFLCVSLARTFCFD